MTVTDETVVEVRNMVNNPVGYSIQELNINRTFDPFETKKLPVKELRALNYKRGGHILLHDYLSVNNNEFREELGIPADAIEYDYTQDDIDRILLKDEEDVLKDTLEFGPQGIVDLVKSRAFKLKIPDVNKREIIRQFTGTDVNKQILLQEQAEAALKLEKEESSDAETATSNTPQRRRRVAVSK